MEQSESESQGCYVKVSLGSMATHFCAWSSSPFVQRSCSTASIYEMLCFDDRSYHVMKRIAHLGHTRIHASGCVEREDDVNRPTGGIKRPYDSLLVCVTQAIYRRISRRFVVWWYLNSFCGKNNGQDGMFSIASNQNDASYGKDWV